MYNDLPPGRARRVTADGCRRRFVSAVLLGAAVSGKFWPLARGTDRVPAARNTASSAVLVDVPGMSASPALASMRRHMAYTGARRGVDSDDRRP
jgi:hypothetical protein